MATPRPEESYSAKDITVLEGLEPVRLRPGMYIGSTGQRGLHHLVYEVVDNAVDEAMAGHNDLIEVTIHPDNSVTVRDRGRGIPVDIIPDQGVSAMTVVLTKLHAGGKFGGEGYKVSGGLHGVGVSVVNALSEWLIAEVERDGKIYRQEFARGVPQDEMKPIGIAGETGTTITFLPDAEIFEETRVLRRDAAAAPARDGVPDARPADLARRRARRRRAGRVPLRGRDQGLRRLHQRGEGPVHRHIVFFESENEAGLVEVAMQWNTSYQESIFSFANNINTHEGGTHMQGFRSALTRTLNKYARDKGLLKEKEDNLEGEDVREGLAAVDLGQAPEPAVRGPDEDEARQPGDRRPRRVVGQREAGGVLRGEPDRRAPDHQQGDRRVARPPRRPQGARADAAQVRAREHVAAGQARRLLDQRPGVGRALHRRGRLRRRLGQAGPRPRLPGDPAAPRARSSTARRTASTRCSRTTRSRR